MTREPIGFARKHQEVWKWQPRSKTDCRSASKNPPYYLTPRPTALHPSSAAGRLSLAPELVGYATAVVEIPPDAKDDWKLVLTLPTRPTWGYGASRFALNPTYGKCRTSVWGIGGSCQPVLTWVGRFDVPSPSSRRRTQRLAPALRSERNRAHPHPPPALSNSNVYPKSSGKRAI
jgi:hypothetical protein